MTVSREGKLSDWSVGRGALAVKDDVSRTIGQTGGRIRHIHPMGTVIYDFGDFGRTNHVGTIAAKPAIANSRKPSRYASINDWLATACPR